MTTAISSKRKVLIIRLSSLGDVVLSTAAIDPFARAGWEVHFMTKASFAPILTADVRIRSIYSFDAQNGERAARAKFFAWCAEEKFDLILDLHDSLRTRFWRWHLRKLAKVFVARKERIRELLILLLRLGRWFGFGRGGRARKMRKAALDALATFGQLAGEPVRLTSVAVSAAAESKVAGLLPQEKFIVLLPGSAWAGKKWPHFAALAERAAGLAPVVVLGGDQDRECDEIAAHAKKVNAKSVSLRGKTSMEESVAVLARSAMVLGNDTGMVHAAEALGKPVLVVEGPTSEALGFSVYGSKSKVVAKDLACRPCSKSGSVCWRFGTRECLRGLSEEAVYIELAAEWRKLAVSV